MKKLIILAAALSLTACGTTGTVKPEVGVAPAAKVPALPDRMKQKAERLPDITDKSLGGVHKDGVNTDVKYNDLAYRYNFLVDAWGCVADAINNRKTDTIDKCLDGAGEGQAK